MPPSILPSSGNFPLVFWLLCHFPDSSVGKESACIAGDPSSIPGLGRSPGEGKGYPTPVFWPREIHGLYSLWGHKESDMTELFSLHFTVN